jgi:hypothetical protein
VIAIVEREPVEGFCEHGIEPSRSIKEGKFLSNCTTVDLSRKAQLHGIT